MYEIKLAFFKVDCYASTAVDKAIGWWTKSKYSHVEILLDKELVDSIDKSVFALSDITMKKYLSMGVIDEYHTGKNEFTHYQFSSSGTFGGVRIKQHRLNTDKWYYKTVIVTDDINKIKDIIDFYKSINGDKYDWLAIAGFIIPVMDRTHRWVCSESCANGLKIINYLPMNLLEPYKISPGKLEEISDIQIMSKAINTGE